MVAATSGAALDASKAREMEICPLLRGRQAQPSCQCRSTIYPVLVKLLEELSEKSDGEPGWGLTGNDLSRSDPPDPHCLRKGGIVCQEISALFSCDGSHNEKLAPQLWAVKQGTSGTPGTSGTGSR